MNSLNMIRNAVVSKSIQVILTAYKDITNSKESHRGELLTEDVRRNQLVKTIIKNKQKYQYSYFVSTESGTTNEECETIGRIDICIFYSPCEYSQEVLSFECKRYHSKNSGLVNVEKTFYTDGLYRYINRKYPCDTGVGGMIAFCESGDYEKVNKNILSVIDKYSTHPVINKSNIYGHNYVYDSALKDNQKNKIEIVSILMDFT